MPVETQGDTNPLLEEAQRIGDLPDHDSDQPTPPSQTRIETDEKGRERQVADPDPNPGTFEMFMGSFGTPARWAGR